MWTNKDRWGVNMVTKEQMKEIIKSGLGICVFFIFVNVVFGILWAFGEVMHSANQICILIPGTFEQRALVIGVCMIGLFLWGVVRILSGKLIYETPEEGA